MSKASRTKGHSFEREIASLLNEQFITADLPFTMKRELSQYQEKDLGDLIGLPGFTIECKRYKQSSTNRPQKAWWDQVIQAAGSDSTPLLVYKFDRQPIEVQFPVMMFSFNTENAEGGVDYYNDYPSRMDFDSFVYLLVCYLKAIYER